MKNKNLILMVISIILICYAVVIGILPMIFNGKLKNKSIIPELERITLLNIDYDSAKLKINPNLSVYVRFNQIHAEKKDVDMKVASAARIEMVMGLSALFSKNYNLKSMNISGADYYEVLGNNKQPEIVYFLDKYSLIAENSNGVKIKTCPIDIKFLKKHSYDNVTKIYSEKKYDDYQIGADAFAQFIDSISKERIKTSY